ncbi:MAG: tyrosine-type recombinase/integrase [Syntrophobacteraceae bacterium]
MDQFRKKTINKEGKKKEDEENLVRNFLEEDTWEGNNIFRPAVLMHFQIIGDSKRLIDLTDELAIILNRYITELRKVSIAEGQPVGYLFSGINDRLVQNSMRRICRLAKVRRRHPHDLRHTYASLLLMEHISPAYVQRQLGHYSIRMTVDIYGHWIPGEGRERLNQALNRCEPRLEASPKLRLLK